MTSTQIKIIGCIVIALVCLIVQVTAFTAEPKYVDTTCPKDDVVGDCGQPRVIQAETLFGTFDLQRRMPINEFTSFKWKSFILASVIEILSVFVLVKALRDETGKAPGAGAG